MRQPESKFDSGGGTGEPARTIGGVLLQNRRNNNLKNQNNQNQLIISNSEPNSTLYIPKLPSLLNTQSPRSPTQPEQRIEKTEKNNKTALLSDNNIHKASGSQIDKIKQVPIKTAITTKTVKKKKKKIFLAAIANALNPNKAKKYGKSATSKIKEPAAQLQAKPKILALPASSRTYIQSNTAAISALPALSTLSTLSTATAAAAVIEPVNIYTQNTQIQKNRNIQKQNLHVIQATQATQKIREVQEIQKKKLPPVKRLKDKFRKSGLSIIESYFNAYFFYYIWKGDKKGRKLKKSLEDVATHPISWSKNTSDASVYEKNIYDKYISAMTALSKLIGFAAKIFSPFRNFFASFGRFFLHFENSSRASRNIADFTKKAAGFILPAASVVFTVLTIVNILSYKPEMELWINGERVGIVSSKKIAADTSVLVGNNISEIINESYEFSGTVKYQMVLAKNPLYIPASQVYNVMYDYSQTSIMSAYGLYIDGELIGAAVKASDIDNVLNEVLEENSDKNTDETVEFANDIRIIEKKYSKNDVVTHDELKNIITYSTESTKSAESETTGNIDNSGNPNSSDSNRTLKAADTLNSSETSGTDSSANTENSNSGGFTEDDENILNIVNSPEYAGTSENGIGESEGNQNSVNSINNENNTKNGDSVNISNSNANNISTENNEDIAAAAASALNLTDDAADTIPRGAVGSLSEANDSSLLTKLSKSSASTSSSSVIQFKKTRTETYYTVIPFEVTYVESNNYDAGTQTVQTKGANGEKKITAEVTYIGDTEISKEIISVETVSNPVNKVVVKGTKVKPKTTPTGKFIRPVRGGYVSSRFMVGGHRGIDLVVPYGTSIAAADGGTVIYAGFSGSYGYHVKIRHSNGFVTLYAHMSKITVNQGATVYQGQEIGKVGSTGNSTGNHLHFEITKDGVLVNPESYGIR